MARASCEKEAAKARYAISQTNYIPSLERLSQIRMFNNGGSAKPSIPSRSKGKEKATEETMKEMDAEEEEEEENDDLFLP